MKVGEKERIELYIYIIKKDGEYIFMTLKEYRKRKLNKILCLDKEKI